jgi:hypothetical protein
MEFYSIIKEIEIAYKTWGCSQQKRQETPRNIKLITKNINEIAFKNLVR